MSNGLWIFIGVIVWQFVCLIVDMITNENEEIVIGTAIGVWLIPIIVIGVIFNFVKLYYYKNFYDGYILMYIQDSVSNTFYMSKRKAKQFNFDNSKAYYVKQVSSGKTWKSAPYKQDVYFGGEYFKGHEMKLYKNS